MILPLSLSRAITAAIVCGALVVAYLIPGEWVNRLSQNGLTCYLYAGLCIYRIHVNDLLTPRLSVSDFQSMLVSRETAQNKIEEVWFLNVMALGPCVYVSLKNDKEQRRVLLPEKLYKPTRDALAKFGIRTFTGFACY